MEAHIMEQREAVRLETERLILRSFADSDTKAMFGIFGDRETNRFFPWFPVKTMKETLLFCRRYFGNEGTHLYSYVICPKENDIPIGYISVGAADSYDMGYGLCRECRHKGLMTEAGRAVIARLKQEGIPYVTATHDVNNPTSGEVMKRLGMTYRYSYEEQWQPKDIRVTFRMYQLNFNEDDWTVYTGYGESSGHCFIEQGI